MNKDVNDNSGERYNNEYNTENYSFENQENSDDVLDTGVCIYINVYIFIYKCISAYLYEYIDIYIYEYLYEYTCTRICNIYTYM
jgi:hypothetical protein